MLLAFPGGCTELFSADFRCPPPMTAGDSTVQTLEAGQHGHYPISSRIAPETEAVNLPAGRPYHPRACTQQGIPQ